LAKRICVFCGFSSGQRQSYAEVAISLGLHRKPCSILNVEGYYDPLLALFDRAVADCAAAGVPAAGGG